jgi:hypothetical protein
MRWLRRWLIDIAQMTLILLSLPFLLVLSEIRERKRRRRDQRPENQRAVALAVAAHNARSVRPAESASIVDANTERCYVLVSEPCRITDANGRVIFYFPFSPSRTLYVVWYADDRVVEIVNSSFKYGIRPEPFVARFEAELATSATTQAESRATPASPRDSDSGNS